MYKIRIMIALGTALCWSLARVQPLSAQSTPAQGAPAKSVSGRVTHAAARPKRPSTAVKTPDPFWIGSYARALESAKASGGLVLVRLAPSSCTTCTVSSDKVINRKGLLDSLKKVCVAGVYLSPQDSDWAWFQGQRTGERRTMDPETGEREAGTQDATESGTAQQGNGTGQQSTGTQSFGEDDETAPAAFLYVDGDGTCLLRCDSAAPGETAYLEGMESALEHRDGMRRVKVLAAGRVMGDSDESNLEEIILEQAWAHQPVDSLLDVYINNLSVDSTGSLRVLRFLMLRAPLLNSNANQLLRQDPALFNEAWQGLSMEERFGVNNRVIAKTWQKAVKDRNQEEAQLAATFAANTNRDPDARLRAFQGVMLEFYYGAGDTTRFLNLAGTYYDRFLMHFNADSLRRADSLFHRGPATSVSRFLATQLLKAAQRVSGITADPSLIAMAHTWAVKAMALYPSPSARETEMVISQWHAGSGKDKAAGPR
jgi:hypothetical protein